MLDKNYKPSLISFLFAKGGNEIIALAFFLSLALTNDFVALVSPSNRRLIGFRTIEGKAFSQVRRLEFLVDQKIRARNPLGLFLPYIIFSIMMNSKYYWSHYGKDIVIIIAIPLSISS